MSHSRVRFTLIILALWLIMPISASHADWLITQDGQRIQTQGDWKVKGRMVVFTSDRGTLSSIRLDEVDLEASEKMTANADRLASEPQTPEDTPQRPSVMILTNEDIARGEGGAGGAEALVARLRQAHQFKDLPGTFSLVNWQDTPQGIRDVMETQFEWMMERRIRDIRLNEVVEDEALVKEVDGTTFEPNVDVSHEMVIDFIPDPDADELVLKLYVGELLGSHFIAAARPVEDY